MSSDPDSLDDSPAGEAANGEWQPANASEANRASNSYWEGSVRAVSIWAMVYGVWSLFSIAPMLATAAKVLRGEFEAPWISTEFWTGFIALYLVFAFSWIVLAIGLFKFRSWARLGILITQISYFLFVLLTASRDLMSHQIKLYYAVGGVLICVAFLAPFAVLWPKPTAYVLTPSYRAVVAETPHLKVRARVPWPEIIVAIGLSIAGGVFLVLGMK